MGKPNQKSGQTKTSTERTNPPSFFRTNKAKTAALKSINSSDGSKYLAREVLDLLGAKMDPNAYISAPEDRLDLVRVKPVSILGDKQYGLFASDFINTGTLLGRYTGKKYSKKAFRRHLDLEENATPHYAMQTNKGIICAEQMGNFTRFANCSSSQPNTAFVELPDGGVGLKAIRPVAKEEQLLVDYNGPCDLPEESQHQLFLNPQDGELSTAELFCEYNKHYMFKSSPENYPSLGVLKGDHLYITKVLRSLMRGLSLYALPHQYTQAEANLLCLKATKQGVIKPAASDVNSDPFTPLMLACYLGQLENVQFLIQNGANVNHQQNLSGKCPLFFALDGYSEAIDKQKVYLDIILELLHGQALISAHDSDYKTFLHKASLMLEPSHLQQVLKQLAKMGVALKDSFNFVDNQDRDIVMICLEERLFASIAVQLKFYPTYFGDQFLPPRGKKEHDYAEKISDILNSYTPAEAHSFFVCLTSAHIARLDLAPLSDLRSKADLFLQEYEETRRFSRT